MKPTPFVPCFCWNEWKKICMHHFSSSKKSLSVAVVVMATKALVPKIASECPTPELDHGCFDLPAWPNRQLCTLGTGRALEPHSHLAAIVCPGGPGRPIFLSFSCLFLSRPLSIALSLLSVFVPQGPVVQLKLSVTQRNPNWLSSAACYQLCTLCICALSLSLCRKV